jgi:hypothetical protein
LNSVIISGKPDVPVVLEGDRQVLFGEAVKILSIAQKAGASQVAIAAQRIGPDDGRTFMEEQKRWLVEHVGAEDARDDPQRQRQPRGIYLH